MLGAAIQKHKDANGILSKKGFVSALAEILPVTRETKGIVINHLDRLVRLRSTRWDSDATKAFAVQFTRHQMSAERFNEVAGAEAKLCGVEGLINRSAKSGQGITKPELRSIVKDAFGTDETLSPHLRAGLSAKLQGKFARHSTRRIAERILANAVSAAKAGAALGFTPLKPPVTAAQKLQAFFFDNDAGEPLSHRAVTEALYDALPLTRTSFDEVRKVMFAAANSGTYKMNGSKVALGRGTRELLDRLAYARPKSLKEKDTARLTLEKNILAAFAAEQVRTASDTARATGQGITKMELVRILRFATQDEFRFHSSTTKTLKLLANTPHLFARPELAEKADKIINHGGPQTGLGVLGVAIKPAFANKLSDY